MKVKRVRKKVTIVVRKGTRKLKDAERSGALAKWKNRIGLGLKVAEAAVVVAAAVKGVRSRGKRRAPTRRRSASRKS